MQALSTLAIEVAHEGEAVTETIVQESHAIIEQTSLSVIHQAEQITLPPSDFCEWLVCQMYKSMQLVYVFIMHTATYRLCIWHTCYWDGHCQLVSCVHGSYCLSDHSY